MNFARRLQMLEQQCGQGPCPTCGDDGTPPEVVVREYDDVPSGPQNCPTCGRVLIITVRLDNAGAE